MLLRPAPLDLGVLADLVERVVAGSRRCSSVGQVARAGTPAARASWGASHSCAASRSRQRRAAVDEPCGAAPARPLALPDRSPERRRPPRRSRSAQSSRSPTRAVGEQVVERLADRRQAELDGQLDQVGVAVGEPARGAQPASASSRTVPAIDSSRIAKSGSIPASTAWRRSHRPQNSWNVPIGAASSPRRTRRQRAGSLARRRAGRGTRSRIRWRSSRAAFSVKVSATIRPQRPALGPLEVAEEPLGQHGRLAAARPGAQGDARARDGQRPRLLLGQRSGRGPPGLASSRSISRLGASSRVLPTARTWPIRQTDAEVAALGAVVLPRVDREDPAPELVDQRRPRTPRAARGRSSQSFERRSACNPSLGEAPVADVVRARPPRSARTSRSTARA